MTVAEQLIGLASSPNIFRREWVDIIEVSMYWNGLPREWGHQDLVDFEKFPWNLSEKEKKQHYARRHRTLDMIFEMAEKIRGGQMKGKYQDLNTGPYSVTPLEFMKYVHARKIDPYDMESFVEDLEESPIKVSVFEVTQKRTAPALASAVIDFRKVRLPPCVCAKKGHNPCCVYKIAELQGKKLHRNQVKECAKKINLNYLQQKGRSATPSEIYYTKEFQNCLKKLRNPLDPSEIVKYSSSLILKNWIPQAIGRGPKGRPPIRRKKKKDF